MTKPSGHREIFESGDWGGRGGARAWGAGGGSVWKMACHPRLHVPPPITDNFSLNSLSQLGSS